MTVTLNLEEFEISVSHVRGRGKEIHDFSQLEAGLGCLRHWPQKQKGQRNK